MRERRPALPKLSLVERSPAWIGLVPQVRARPALCLAAALLLAAVSLISRGARAEVHVSGDRKAVTIEAKDASVQDVLNALRESFGFTFESGAPLDKSVTGSFKGSLDEVVASLLFLKDYSYVYSKSGRSPMLRVFGVGQDSSEMEDFSSSPEGGDPTLNAPPQLQPELPEDMQTDAPPPAPVLPHQRER